MSRRGVPVVLVMSADDEVTVIRGGANSDPGKLCRKRVPAGWIVWPLRQGVRASYFVPDRKHEWKPELMESGAPRRISAGETTREIEVAAMAKLERETEGSPIRRTPEAFARLLEETKRDAAAGGRGSQRVQEAS